MGIPGPWAVSWGGRLGICDHVRHHQILAMIPELLAHATVGKGTNTSTLWCGTESCTCSRKLHVVGSLSSSHVTDDKAGPSLTSSSAGRLGRQR